ncbi:MAG: hypothetical protein ACE5HQ_11755 [Gemmatimonadota bacterium]
MGVQVEEIRDRARRLKAAIARERYEIRAGLKLRSSFGELYAAHSLLLRREILPTIQRALAESGDEERRRLRWLLAWVAEQQVQAALAPMEDELHAWESSARLPVDGERISLRKAPVAIRNQADRRIRLALEAARSGTLEEAVPLQVDLLHREREAVAELGLGEFLDARERLSGVGIHALVDVAERVLAATEDRYRDLLAYLARKVLRVEPSEATRADGRWIRRMVWLDDRFRLAPTLDAVQKDLRELGLPLEAEGAVRLDLQERPLKSTQSFCAALDVPHEIILVVAPHGGWADCRALLHEVGHALHFAYTAEQLPFEYRELGDTAVTETYAVLFELLTLEASWLRRTAGLSGDALRGYFTVAGFVMLHRLRRLAGRLLYEVELYTSELPGQMGPRYAEILTRATGFRYDERTFLEGLDRGFWVARRLRAWMLQAILRKELRERYDEDWDRNPGAGPFLCELFSAGQRDDSSQLAVQLGAEVLGPEALLSALDGWLPP